MRFVLSSSLFASVIAMVLFLIVNDFLLFLICVISVFAVLTINYFDVNGISSLKNPIIRSKSRIIVDDIKYTPREFFIKKLTELRGVKSLYNFAIQKHHQKFERSGIIVTPEKVGQKTVIATILATLFSITLSMVLYSLYGSYWVFFLLAIPAVVFLQTSILDVNVNIAARKKRVEDELLFFVVFCDIVDNTQSNIYRAFEELAEAHIDVFPAMKKESFFIKREIEWFGKSLHEVFRDLSINHPSKQFADFVLGYITNESAGGKITGNYFETKINELYELKQQALESYVQHSQIIAPMGVFMLSMIPMFLIIYSIFESGNAVFLLIMGCLVLIPVGMVMSFRKLDGMIPLITDHIPYRKEPIVFACAVFVVCFIMELQTWEIVAYPLIAWSFLNHFMMKKFLNKAKDFEGSIPRFVMELNQMMVGWSFMNAFSKLAEKQNYNHTFNSFLHSTHSRVNAGEPLNYVLISTKINSWMSRLMIQLISHTAKSGVVSNHTMKKLAMLSQKWLDVKKRMFDGTVVSLFLAYFGPILSLMLIIFIPTFSITEQVNTFSSITNIQGNESFDKRLIHMNYLLVFVIAFFGMLLIGKIRSATIHNSIHVGVILLVLAGIIHLNEHTDLLDVLV